MPAQRVCTAVALALVRVGERATEALDGPDRAVFGRVFEHEAEAAVRERHAVSASRKRGADRLHHRLGSDAGR